MRMRMRRFDSIRSGRKPTRYDFDYASTNSSAVDLIDVFALDGGVLHVLVMTTYFVWQVFVTDQQFLNHCRPVGGCKIRVAVAAYSATEWVQFSVDCLLFGLHCDQVP